MTAAGALAVTGVVLLVLIALPCAMYASDTASWRNAERPRRVAWIALGTGAAFLVAAAWTATLS